MMARSFIFFLCKTLLPLRPSCTSSHYNFTYHLFFRSECYDQGLLIDNFIQIQEGAIPELHTLQPIKPWYLHTYRHTDQREIEYYLVAPRPLRLNYVRPTTGVRPAHRPHNFHAQVLSSLGNFNMNLFGPSQSRLNCRTHFPKWSYSQSESRLTPWYSSCRLEI